MIETIAPARLGRSFRPARHTLTNMTQSIANFGGDVIAPKDEIYDDARRVWNAMFDRRPSLIVRPTSVADVATAIRYGRDRDLEIAIRSGAHSAAGHSTTDGGLLIDMSKLRGVSVDPTLRTARVLGGTLLGELDIAAQAHGLVCPVGVIGHTGVAGLTLGGGIGRLQRNFGLTIDNLLAVELVTADGRTVRASATEEPDLFWGIRGAGANFGVVTAFEFQLHEFAGVLHRGTRIYPASQVHEVWGTVRELSATLPDAVALIMAVAMAEPAADYPDEVTGKPIVIIGFNHSGDAADVARDTAALEAGPKPVVNTLASQPYLEVQTANDLAMGWGHRSYIMGGWANDFRAEVLDAAVEHIVRAPAGSSFAVSVQRGAIARVPEEATAFTGREARFDVSADTEWEDPAQDETSSTWVREAMAIVEPDTITGRYVNEISEAGPDSARITYGDAKLARLTTLKRAWDPENVFRLNHNIAP